MTPTARLLNPVLIVGCVIVLSSVGGSGRFGTARRGTGRRGRGATTGIGQGGVDERQHRIMEFQSRLGALESR